MDIPVAPFTFSPKFKEHMNDTCIKKHVVPIRFWIRLLVEILMGVLLNVILFRIIFVDKVVERSGYVFMIGMMILVSEGIFVFDRLVDKRLPWHTHQRPRVMLLFSFSIVWIVLLQPVGEYFKKFATSPNIETDPMLHKIGMMAGIFVIILYVFGLIAFNYHRSLNEFTMENEQLKQEQLEMNYRSLQDKLNPHFLFNSLSTLIAMIRQDQQSAVTFAENLSDIYRYVLLKKDQNWVSLAEETQFVEVYASLHAERLGEGLQVEIAKCRPGIVVPPMSLQLLVENAMKHNVATPSSPLKIKVYCTNEHVCVENNLQRKQSSYSTQTGLNNLVSRYRHLAGREVDVVAGDDVFLVKLPLVTQSEIS